jgi:hypothetical protein
MKPIAFAALLPRGPAQFHMKSLLQLQAKMHWIESTNVCHSYNSIRLKLQRSWSQKNLFCHEYRIACTSLTAAAKVKGLVRCIEHAWEKRHFISDCWTSHRHFTAIDVWESVQNVPNRWHKTHTFKKIVSELSILTCRDGIDSNAVLPSCFKCQYLQCPKPTSLV